MAHSLRWAGCAALLGLLLAGSCALRPEVFADLGLDWWHWPDILRQHEAESEHGEALTRDLQVTASRMQIQDRICRELIDGRITLAEATRRHLELPGTTERMWWEIRRLYGGATAEESMGRLVIAHACGLLSHEPDRAETLRRRWQAELAQMGTQDPPKP